MTSNIIDKIIELSPEEWRVWILLILLVVFCYKPFIDFRENLKKKKANRLKEALTEGSDYLDEASKKFIQSNLSEYYFKQAVGLDVTQDFRKALMELYQKDNCPIDWHHFRRVIRHMEYDNNKITGVKIPIAIEMLFGAFSVSLGMAITVITGLICHRFATSYKVADISDIIVVLLFMAVCIVFGLISIVFIFRPYLIYTSAKFVNRHAQKGNEKYIPACLYEKIICYEYSTLFHSWVQRLGQWSWVQWLVQWSQGQRLVQWLNEQWRSSLFPLVQKCWWLLWLPYYIGVAVAAYLILCFYFKNV